MKFLQLASLLGLSQQVKISTSQSHKLVGEGKGDSLKDDFYDFGENPVDELNRALETNKFKSPSINWSKPYDHVGHSASQVSQDAARVILDITDKRPGAHECQQGDWAVVHYQMYNAEDGAELENSEVGDPAPPMVYQIGSYQVSKCQDIAVQQMRSGETAMIECPNDLDLGSGVQNQYTRRFNARWLDKSVDTKYKYRLVECGLDPEHFKRENLEDLSAGYPFYLLSKEEDETMAMTMDSEDKYAPRTTGVHNIKLSKWKGRMNPDKNQQWIWSSDDQTLTNVGVGSVIFEGFNRNIIGYKYIGVPNQRWRYSIGTFRLENKFTGFAIDIAGDDTSEGQNINTGEPDQTNRQKWVVEYHDPCNHGHDDDHMDDPNCVGKMKGQPGSLTK